VHVFLFPAHDYIIRIAPKYSSGHVYTLKLHLALPSYIALVVVQRADDSECALFSNMSAMALMQVKDSGMCNAQKDALCQIGVDASEVCISLTEYITAGLMAKSCEWHELSWPPDPARGTGADTRPTSERAL
jgi:hypothetical protein